MDQIIRTGDQVQFMPNFGAAILLAPAITVITGSAMTVKVAGMAACVQGDELKVQLPGIPYMSGSFVTPGTCMLTIQALGPDQTSKKTKIGGKPVILKGTTFTAKMTIMSPAMQPNPPAPPVPDPVAVNMGTGMFITTNMTVMDKG
jgi:uncharacterized Zn-binding protein involved in type VI secretion